MLTSLLLAALALGGSGTVRPAPGDYMRTLRVDGAERRYLLHVPPRLGASAAAVVVMLHGSGGTGRQLAAGTGFSAEANRRGFIVLYPDGIDRHWNDGRQAGGADDVAFIRALLDSVAPALGGDARRYYAAGISNGAMFAHRLACDLPGRFAAIASVAGAVPEELAPRCTAIPATSVIAFNGTADRLVHYERDGGGVGGLLGAVESATHWAEIAHCATPPAHALEPDRAPADGTRVRLTQWSGCDTGTAVVLYTIEAGGHNWPGAARVRIPLLGRTTRDMSATRTIGAFFSAHRR